MKLRIYKSFFYTAFFTVFIFYSSSSLIRLLTAHKPDFTIFYLVAQDLIQKNNPYTDSSLFTVFNYPPVSALFFVPFTLFSITLAQTIFTLLNIVSLFIIVVLSLRILQKKVTLAHYLFFVAVSFLFFPTKFTLGMGQTNLIAYTALLGSYYFYKKKKSVHSGIFFAFACILKPVLGIMILFFLFHKKWKVIMYALVTIVICMGITMSFSSPQYFIQYVTTQLPQLFDYHGRETYYNQGLLSFISRVTPDLSLRKNINLIGTIVLLLSSVIVLRKKNISENLQFSFLLILLVLINTLSWQHHFVFLLFPYLMLYFEVQAKNKLYFFIFLCSFLLVGTNIAHPEIKRNVFLLSHVFLGSMILFILTIKIHFFQKK